MRRVGHCIAVFNPGVDFETAGVSATCEVFNERTQTYDSFPGLPLTFDADGESFNFQLVRCA
jgi:hypothetical protein